MSNTFFAFSPITTIITASYVVVITLFAGIFLSTSLHSLFAIVCYCLICFCAYFYRQSLWTTSYPLSLAPHAPHYTNILVKKCTTRRTTNSWEHWTEQNQSVRRRGDYLCPWPAYTISSLTRVNARASRPPPAGGAPSPLPFSSKCPAWQGAKLCLPFIDSVLSVSAVVNFASVVFVAIRTFPLCRHLLAAVEKSLNLMPLPIRACVVPNTEFSQVQKKKKKKKKVTPYHVKLATWRLSCNTIVFSHLQEKTYVCLCTYLFLFH